MNDQKKQNVNQIPEEIGQYLPWPKVYDRMDLDSRGKDVAVHLVDWYRCSMTNPKYTDEFGVYALYTNRDLVEDVGCCDKTLVKAKQELEGLGIIAMERKGNGNLPNRVYIDLSRMHELCISYGTAINIAAENGKNHDDRQIPKELGQYMVCPRVFDRLDLDSTEKDLAVHLLDRYRLSLARAGYRDEDGVPYAVYSNDRLMADIGCSLKKLRAAKRKLAEYGIICERQISKRGANRIYVDLHRIHVLCILHGTTLGSDVKRGRACAVKNAPSLRKKYIPSKNMNKNNSSALGEQDFLMQWGLSAPVTTEDRKVQAALWSLLVASEPVVVNDQIFSAEMQQLAAEWAQAADVEEVLGKLTKRNAKKTVPYVRAVLLAHMSATHGEDMQHRLRMRQMEKPF